MREWFKFVYTWGPALLVIAGSAKCLLVGRSGPETVLHLGVALIAYTTWWTMIPGMEMLADKLAREAEPGVLSFALALTVLCIQLIGFPACLLYVVTQ